MYFCLAPVPLTAVLAPSLWLWLARATSNGFNSSLLKSLLQPIISHGSFSWAALPRFSWAPLPPSHVLAPSLKRKKPRLHLSASFLIPLIVHGCTTRIPQGFAPAPDRPPCHCALTCGSSPVAMPVAVAVSVAVRLPLSLCAHLWQLTCGYACGCGCFCSCALTLGCALTCGGSPVAMPVAVAVSVAVRLPLPLCAHLWPQGV